MVGGGWPMGSGSSRRVRLSLFFQVLLETGRGWWITKYRRVKHWSKLLTQVQLLVVPSWVIRLARPSGSLTTLERHGEVELGGSAWSSGWVLSLSINVTCVHSHRSQRTPPRQSSVITVLSECNSIALVLQNYGGWYRLCQLTEILLVRSPRDPSSLTFFFWIGSQQLEVFKSVF